MRQKMAEGRAICSDRMEKVSPNRMVWVNGHGCQRAYSYWYYAAVAEMLVALRSPRPGSPDVHYVHLCLF